MGLCSSKYEDDIKFLKERGVTQQFLDGISGWNEKQHNLLKIIIDEDGTRDDLAEVEQGTETDSFLPEESNVFQKKFDDFLSQQPSWNDCANVVLFWNNYPEEHYKNILVIRRQMSGLCFTPVVLQHYLLCIYRIKRGQALDFKILLHTSKTTGKQKCWRDT